MQRLGTVIEPNVTPRIIYLLRHCSLGKYSYYIETKAQLVNRNNRTRATLCACKNRIEINSVVSS